MKSQLSLEEFFKYVVPQKIRQIKFWLKSFGEKKFQTYFQNNMISEQNDVKIGRIKRS